MTKLPYPAFLSLEINQNSVYRLMLYGQSAVEREMKPETLNQVLRILEETSPIGVSLYGNLSCDLSGLISVCRERGIQLGYDLACDKAALRRLDAFFDEMNLIRLVLYSLDEAQHNAFDDSNQLSLLRSFANNLASTSKGRVMLIPLVAENCHELERLICFALESGFRANPFPVPCLCATRMGAHPLSAEAFLEAASLIGTCYSKYGDRIYLDMPLAYKTLKKTAVCPAFRISADISSLGQIRPCKFMDEEYGNVGQLREIWKVAGDLVSSECMNCEERSACGGGCLANASMAGRRDQLCKKQVCHSTNGIPQ